MQSKAKLAIVGALGLAGAAFYAGAHRSELMTRVTSSTSGPDVDDAAGGRAVLNRIWFDGLPTSGKEDHTLWLFLAGGIGVQRTGSMFRATTELFELERAKNRLELITLQDDKTTQVTFEIKACNDKPPFDLCLRFNEPLRGAQVLYGFGDEDEADAKIAWLHEARARVHAEADLRPHRAADLAAGAP